MRRAAAFGLASLSACCLLLTGCSSRDPAPNYSSVSAQPSATSTTATTATSAPSSSTTPTIPTTGPNVQPGETPPTEPAEARQNTNEGAIAFASYYLATLDWVYATSEPTILEPFFSERCDNCSKTLAYLDGLVANGSHFVGGRIQLRRSAIVPNDGRNGATYAISAEVNAQAAQVLTSTGAVSTQFQSTQSATLTDWLAWTGTAWKIVDEGYA